MDFEQVEDAIIEQLKKGTANDLVINEIMKQSKFNYLTSNIEQNEITSSKFSSERKSAVYIKEALLNAPKCKICGGYIHRNSITIDHIDRKEDGGLGNIENGQIAHPYCNTTVKN